jgi:hypothetical protein
MELVAGQIPLPLTVEDWACSSLTGLQLSQLSQLARLLKCEIRTLTLDKLKIEQVSVCCDRVGIVVSLFQDGLSWSLLQHSKEAELEKGRKVNVKGFPFRCRAESQEFIMTDWEVPITTGRMTLTIQSPGSLSTGHLLSSPHSNGLQSPRPSLLPSIRNSTVLSSLRSTKPVLGSEHILVNELKVLDQARTYDGSQTSLRVKTARTLEGVKELQSMSDLQVAMESVSKQVLSMQFVESPWFQGECKLKALDNLYYLEKLLKDAAGQLIRLFGDLKADNAGMKTKVAGLEATVHKLLSFESKLVGCETELRKCKQRDTEAKHYFEAHQRKDKLKQVQLEAEVDSLKNSLMEITQTGSREMLVEQLTDLRVKYRQTVSEYTAAMDQRETKISQLIQEKGIIRQELQSLNDFKENFEAIMKENQLKLAHEQAAKEKLREQVREVTERLLMYTDETRNDRAALKQAKHDCHKLDLQCSEAKNKLSQLEFDITVGNVITLSSDSVAVVDLNDPLFASVREAPVSSANNLLYGLPREPVATGEEEDVKAPDVSEVDLSLYKFNRPSFAGLIRIPNMSQLKLQLPFNNWVELTIRGILDSKYYEHLMCFDDSGRVPSRFPEFVYGWFSSFKVDEKTHQVVASELWWGKEAAERARLNLLLALKNDKLKKVWEIMTFIEFLQEDFMIDELGFFLHCRAMLFEGPQLTLSTGRFSALHFVSYLKVCEVVDRVMHKISARERQEIRDLLMSKTRNKANKLTIEASLALRVMLEYYRREKKCRVIVVKQLFEAAPKTEGIVDFQAFKEICLNLNHDFSETSLARYYRECWILGNGRMDASVFLLMANETAFFYRALRLKGNWEAPPLNENTEIDATAGEYPERMAEAYNHFSKMSKNYIRLIKDAFTAMGCSEFTHQLKLLEDSLKRKCRGNPEDYNGRNLADIYRALWRLLEEMKLAYQEYNYSHTEYVSDIKDLSKPCSAFFNTLQQLNLQKISTNRLIRQIQKNWRVKSRKEIGVLATVIKGVSRFKKALK